MEVERTVMNCFDDSVEQPSPDQEPSKQLSSGATTAPPPPTPNAYFDCSICLDFAVDPVVTLCGHLYCWPCIYKWLQVETTSPHQCPVCKAPLSQKALVPLYGRGGLTAKTKGSHNQSLNIPNRPSVLRDVIASVIEEHSSSTNDEYIDLHPPMQRQPLHHHHYPYHSNVFNSTAGGVLGGLAIAILPLVSRNRHEVGESMYFSRPYQLIENGNSPSQRRHGMRVENWLHQIWVFLFCFAVLCLLLF